MNLGLNYSVGVKKRIPVLTDAISFFIGHNFRAWELESLVTESATISTQAGLQGYLAHKTPPPSRGTLP